ncbi:transcriptional regulator GcvA [Insolitispirillum peregrinum]|uniref:LysR family transcriptional regulator, glycine cleavage system transcriptional activator n=1 Tax=Insolitispirillum peregrinum TaxID=80876 RepID=A0A1N7NLE6_9PROT|nr:transcriptional regulator GcvA [Insolitispirillum peregrinum]SIS99111.1 LysR family transcriptional regulator, glycine cleavage system transcriptional activator [Insolitispirillum peregrinum]
MQHRVSLKAIQAFEAAARHGSFALAAEELLVTPSAVSHQVKFLEEQIGVRLFHRVHRAVTLTDAGRRYAEEIAAAFARIDAATRNVGRTEKTDILTVHSTPSFATQWLMPRLARFSARHPDIDVRLNASATPSDLLSEDVDVDIRYGSRLQPTGTIVIPFPVETIVPLCAPHLLEGPHPLRTVEDLRHHVLIHSERCLVGWADWHRDHRKVKLDIAHGPRFDRSFMSISAAVDGMGVCLESLLLVQRELQTRRLVAPFGLKGLQVQGYTLNILKTRNDLPKIQRWQEWLFAELERPANDSSPRQRSGG